MPLARCPWPPTWSPISCAAGRRSVTKLPPSRGRISITPEPVVVVPAAWQSATHRPVATPAAAPKPSEPAISVGLHLSSFDWPGGREQLGDASAVDRQRCRGGRRRPHLDDGSPPPDPSGRRGMGRPTRARTPRCRGWRRSPSGSASACWCRRRFAINPQCSPNRSPRSMCCRAAGRCAGSASGGSLRSTTLRASTSRRSADATRTSRMRCRCCRCCGARDQPRFEGATRDDRRGAVLSAADPAARSDRRRRFRRAAHTATGGALRRRVQPVRRTRCRRSEGRRARPALRRDRPRRATRSTSRICRRC